MLRGIRRTWPGAEITLVLHDVFGSVPVPSHLYDRLAIFPYSKVAGTLSRAREEWRGEVGRIREWVRDLSSEPYDLLVNLTHSDLAGFLSALIPHRTLSGGLIAPDRTRVVVGPWLTYFWASQTARAWGCFNLVDVQSYAAGVSADGRGLEMAVADEAHAWAHAWLSDRSLGSRPLVAVQLGASEERKRWPAEKVAEALNRIPPAEADVVLVGTRSELPLADQARARLTRPVHVALGETSLTELAALLSRCSVLLTNDTGTMHVASAMGTRIVDLSTGNVFVHETAPYGEGHFVLEPRTPCFPCTAGSTCHHFQCREAFTPDDVAALVRHAIGLAPMPTPADGTILQGRFVKGGRILYRPLWPAHAGSVERRRQASAIMWSETLPTPAHPTVAADVDPFPDRDSGVESPGTCTALRTFAADANRVAGVAASVTSAPANRRAALGRDVEDGLRRLQLQGQVEPMVSSIAGFLRVRLESTFSRDLTQVSNVYAREIEIAAARAARLAALLDGARVPGATGPTALAR